MKIFLMYVKRALSLCATTFEIVVVSVITFSTRVCLQPHKASFQMCCCFLHNTFIVDKGFSARLFPNHVPRKIINNGSWTDLDSGPCGMYNRIIQHFRYHVPIKINIHYLKIVSVNSHWDHKSRGIHKYLLKK